MDFGGLAVGGEPLERRWSERQWRTAAMRSPKDLRPRILASARLRMWYPVHRFQNARPSWRVARRVSLRARAAGQSFFHGLPFLRIGMIGVPPRVMMALWQRRVS